jgi:hypothetical protein
MNAYESMPLALVRLFTLEPGEWHKQRHLAGAGIEEQVRSYYLARGHSRCVVHSSVDSEGFNRRLEGLSGTSSTRA